MTLDTPAEIFKRATAVALKAIAAKAELEVTFAAESFGVTEDRVRVPSPSPSPALAPAEADFIRGAADAVALRLRHRDEKIYRHHLPRNSAARAVFEALEQSRCEALGARRLPGVAHNLNAFLAECCKRQGLPQAQSQADVALPDALRILAFECFTAQALPPGVRRVADLWRDWIEAKVGPRLGQLPELLADQSAFAAEVHRLLEAMDLDGTLEDIEGEDGRAEHEAGIAAAPVEPGITTASPSQPHEAAHADAPGLGAGRVELTRAPADAARADAHDKACAPERAVATGEFEGSRGPLKSYRVFTSCHDETVRAADLCTVEDLTRLRLMLDQQVRPIEPFIVRLANRLQRRLMAQAARSWEFDLEEGTLDAARLARVVVSPSDPRSYKREQPIAFGDTVVSLLLDNSGSMRRKPITLAAISADILTRTLERCGVKTEILGFTTRAWRGGRSREAWIKCGRPPLPGRLNDVRHIIYKSADEPWRRARRNLGLMLLDELLKDNIDGEALLWAHARLLARPEQRRILIVISDGAPADESTLSVNPSGYLSEHLRAVIAWIETQSDIELLAIGVGHDVRRYYRRAVTISEVEQLGGALMQQLGDRLDQD
jgi:cobaltochelatase CobT